MNFENYLNEEIEQRILGRFLAHNDDINLYPDLKVDHFLFEENATIFERMLKANEEGKPFVMRTLSKDEKDKLYINKLSGLSFVGNVDKEVNLLIDSSDKYNALTKAQELLEQAETEDVDVFTKLSEISTRDLIEKIDDSPDAMLRELQDKMNNGVLGIKTGIDMLDYNINDLQNGRLYVVGARSGMGKSAFMCSIINNIEPNYKVGIISLEMKSTELKQRIACIRGEIPHWKIEKGKCEKEFDAYANALFSIKNLVIDDRGGINCQQVIAKIRQMVKKAKCDIVFIDHIGLVQVSDRGNLAHEIGKTTALLKSVSKELNIPIVCLCQINRAAEKESNKRPKMSDLRDSGRIEEDADCVILLYRDGYYSNQDVERDPTEYIVSKCRNGKRGVVNGTFVCQLMKFC
ncbi:MAG: hypothetical protein KBT03_09625 [Bacteroidales bacterium]|nr:hypothetical protein [Candidatus Scybalousia scybalohippi]